jgi:hypothetical protein
MVVEEFPHHGEHLENDEKQAELTLSLTSVFVIFACVLAFILILGHS